MDDEQVRETMTPDHEPPWKPQGTQSSGAYAQWWAQLLPHWRSVMSMIAAALLTPAAVATLVVWAGMYNERSLDCIASLPAKDQPIIGQVLTIYQGWIQALIQTDGVSWACDSHRELLLRVLQSSLLLLCALAGSFVCALAANLWQLWTSAWQPDEGRPSAVLLWLAPTMLWAAVISVVYNSILIRIQPWLPIPELHRWLFPLAYEPIRYTAAIIVLALGSGTFWTLNIGLKQEIRRHLLSDLLLATRANGLSVLTPLTRNLTSPLLTLLGGRVPILFGEVIIVEFIFQLDGVGRSLYVRAEGSDAPALMTLSLGLVCLTLLLRQLARLATHWLHPAVGVTADSPRWLGAP